MLLNMNMIDIIKTRKSIRTFDGRDISKEDREKISSYVASITNPYEIPVKFIILDAKEYGLSSPVIVGENLYIAGKVPNVEHSEEAFGYSFEKMVLYAWSLGIGTTWIGGTLNRELFEKAVKVDKNEIMMIVSPLGYPSNEKSSVDIKLRNIVHGDERLSASELFYDGNFSTPLKSPDNDILEVIRWAPSAANMQPWRIVKQENNYHFYEKHTKKYRRTVGWDVQKIDIGIAICHLMSIVDDCKFKIDDPKIDMIEDTEYIATVTI